MYMFYSKEIFFFLSIIILIIRSENKLIEKELESLFTNLSLQKIYNIEESNIGRYKYQQSHLGVQCSLSDIFDLDISNDYQKIYIYYDKFYTSRTYYEQISCAMLRKRSTTNSIIGIEQFGSLNVSPHNSCRVFRSLIGKTNRNHLHIIISGYPLTCRKEFRGLGTIAMISPTQYGCSFDGISNRFPNYRKKIIEVFNNLPLELRKNITHEGVKKNIEIDRTFFSSKGCEKTRLSIIIENHFSQISESIKIMDSTHGEKMVSSSLRKALKLIFVFVKSQYKHDIEIITDKSSVNSNKFNIDHNDDGDGYINWITTVTSTIIPFTIFIGGLIIVTTFVINKKSDKKIKEDQNNAFKGGIIIDDFISKNNDSDSDY